MCAWVFASSMAEKMIKINKSLLGCLKHRTRKQFKDLGRMAAWFICFWLSFFLSILMTCLIWLWQSVCVCVCALVCGWYSAVQLPLKWGHIPRRFIGYVQQRKQIYMTLNSATFTSGLTYLSSFLSPPVIPLAIWAALLKDWWNFSTVGTTDLPAIEPANSR